MDIRIQYEGFVVEGSARTYNFLVIDGPGASRQFTVKVPLESFRSTPLKYQDGPPISFEFLRRELDRETQKSPVKARLQIGAETIQEYLNRHYPRKRP